MSSEQYLSELLRTLNCAPVPRSLKSLQQWRAAIAERALRLQKVRFDAFPPTSMQRRRLRSHVAAMFEAARLPTTTAPPLYEASNEYWLEITTRAPVDRVRCCPSCRCFFEINHRSRW